MSTQPLETVAELAQLLERGTAVEAAQNLTDWVRRRDQVAKGDERDGLASALDVLATEFHHEAGTVLDQRSAGLDLAAAVLTDTAGGIRVGDNLSAS